MATQRGRKHENASGSADAQAGEPTAGTLARKSKPTGDLPRTEGAGTPGEGAKRSSDSQDVGSFIRAQREAAQVSIRQLAERAGVSNPPRSWARSPAG